MKQGIIGIVALTVIGIGLMVSAQAAVVENIKRPVDESCFNDCTEEWVDFHGYVHEALKVTDDGNGGFHISNHINYRDVTGTGENSGDNYRVTGAYNINVNLKAGVEFTEVHNGQIIRPGKGGNFLVHFTYHMTANANGEVTSYVDNIEIKCTDQ